MLEPFTLVVIAATFLIAGAVKGVIGLGLPTVSLAVLAVALDLPQAMALLLVPSFVTNLWQAAVGGNAGAILRRTWPFLAMATVTVWLGAEALTRVDLAVLSILLGLVLAAYAAVGLAGLRLAVSPRYERWTAPFVGAANGLLTGMTGSFVVPGVMYLQAIGLSRDMLVQAMGMLFSLSTLALGVALGGRGLLAVEQAAVSTACLVPAMLGMVIGQRLRQRLSEPRFRRVFFFALLLLGGYIAANGLRKLL